MSCPNPVSNFQTGLSSLGSGVNVGAACSMQQRPVIAPGGAGAAAVAFTLSPAQSGSIIQISANGSGAAIQITLPVLADVSVGCFYDFQVIVAQGGSAWVIRPAAATSVSGVLVMSTPSCAATNGQNSVTITATGVKGDTLRVWSDGVQWQYLGFSGAAAGMSSP